MKKWLMIITTFLSVFSIMAVALPAHAQTRSPEGVIRGIQAALNAGNPATALTLVAENAVIIVLPAPPGTKGLFVGKAEIQAWWQQFTSSKGQIELGEVKVHGDMVTWTARISTNPFKQLGVDPLDFTGVGLVQGGLLKSYVWSMTEASLVRLDAALQSATSLGLAQRYIDDLWNQGKLAIADEIIAANFVDHTPRPGLGTDLAALKQDIAGFHKNFPNQSAQFRVDERIATADRVVLRGVLLLPGKGSASAAKTEGPGFMIILGLKEGKISERWATFIGWGN